MGGRKVCFIDKNGQIGTCIKDDENCIQCNSNAFHDIWIKEENKNMNGEKIMERQKLPVTVVAATKYTSGGGIELPWRYVVLKWDKGSSAHEFSRHMQVKDVKEEFNDQIFYYGHYYCDYLSAETDMIKSMESNNREYGSTNVSHIPGMDFMWDFVKE